MFSLIMIFGLVKNHIIHDLQVTSLNDVKASGNWMYAAKLDGEGASMYDAANALRDAMIELGIAIDGGKDSLSMATQAGGETVKAPGNLVISAYVTCPDISKTVTPDLKVTIQNGFGQAALRLLSIRNCHTDIIHCLCS